MLNIGSHLSISKGFLHIAKEAASIDANTFQFFTRNPRGGSSKQYDINDINSYIEYASNNGFAPVVAHAPYTLNACSADEKTRNFAHLVFEEDLAQLDAIPNVLYNFHPGSHVGQGIDKGIELICDTLNDVLKPQQNTIVLLETMAGKGSEVGSRFEELKRIIDGVELDQHLGVCLDTCHVSDAGYDIVNNLDGVLEEFDKIIGLDRLKALHLNDSKNPINAHKDRHELIGKGYLGIDTFKNIVNHPFLKNLPMELETPNDISGYKQEIDLLKSLIL